MFDFQFTREILTVLLLSTISGSISIMRRIHSGQQSSWLWVISEYLTAIMCGYLMYSVYPYIDSWLPNWITLTVAVAVAAHSGGRIVQASEVALLKRVEKYLGNGD